MELDDGRRVHFHFDDEKNGQLLELSMAIGDVGPGVHVYCCGPEPMLKAFEVASSRLPPDQLHMEHFSAREDIEASVAAGFTVVLARAGISFVIPQDKTILEVLQAHGIELRYSCTEGVCGECETTVLDGIPDHRDVVLNPGERATNMKMMICCSRSKSETITLDL